MSSATTPDGVRIDTRTSAQRVSEHLLSIAKEKRSSMKRLQYAQAEAKKNGHEELALEIGVEVEIDDAIAYGYEQGATAVLARAKAQAAQQAKPGQRPAAEG